MYKTVLIAGGAGFLGSYLCDYYIAQGAEVVCVDNFSSGAERNVQHLTDHDKFTLVRHDIVQPLDEAVADRRYGLIINMASPASPPYYQTIPIETLRVGSIGTENLLQLAVQHKARFFHASTSEVYGDPQVHPQPETYKGSVNCYGPRSMYDEAKRYAEALIRAYRDKHGVNSAIGRFFNTYGPRMDAKDGRVVSNFVVQALQGKPLTIYGDGTQTRSFCYVDDLIRGIVALIDSNEEGPINLGNPGEFTMLELAEKVIKLTGTKSELTHQPLPGDDPLQRQPVIDLAKQKLGWEPTIPLDEGLAKTIAYFKEIVNKHG